MGASFTNFFLFSLIFSICFNILPSSSASISPKQSQHFPSVMVEGSIFCNSCFQQASIPGALIAVQCVVEEIGGKKVKFQKKVKTNEHGVFRFRLPLKLSRNFEALKTCSVKLVRSRHSFGCSMASSSSETSSSGLRLKSSRQGVRVFSAGFLVCNHEPKLSRKRVRPALFFPPPIPFLPPPSIPFLPSPPNVGGIPLPPNPLQPPPSILPPLPFQPPPPPFLGIPPLPNIPPLPKIPPVPFLVPPPPPPPPAVFPPLPFPPVFPPLPFPPIFPGNPPPAATAGRTIP